MGSVVSEAGGVMFGRKKPLPPSPPKPCDHHWQDFPWIFHAYTNDKHREVHLVITEPYVCIHCKKRKDVVLLNEWWTCESEKATDALIDETREKYADHIQEIAIVEDMIADMQLVDQDYLKYYRMVTGVQAPKPTLKTESD